LSLFYEVVNDLDHPSSGVCYKDRLRDGWADKVKEDVGSYKKIVEEKSKK